MNTNESFWIKVTFTLIFTIISSLVFVILTKFIFKIPVLTSREILVTLKVTEDIFDIQKKCTKKTKKVHKKIKGVTFDLVQVQIINEIDKEIKSFRKIYRDKDMNQKYLFGEHSYRILKFYLDLNEEVNILKKNNIVLNKNLSECKANI